MSDSVKVLVVDDQQDIRALLDAALGVVGYRVTEAESGTEALAYLGSATDLPDVVLLDIQMPVIDGWEVLHRIRDDLRTRDLPVIVCTVKASHGDAERAWRLGCDGYVTKPLDLRRLFAEVERVVSASAVERARARRRALDEISIG